jgi:hypothetical protein
VKILDHFNPCKFGLTRSTPNDALYESSENPRRVIAVAAQIIAILPSFQIVNVSLDEVGDHAKAVILCNEIRRIARL